MARNLPNLKRRPPSRAPQWRFTLFCEGKNTEPAYFRALQRYCACAQIEIHTEKAAGVPYTIAEKAVDAQKRSGKRNSFEEHDQIWAVFDRDDHPRFDEAIRLCTDNKVQVARSNPCFEVWLILHFEDFHRPDGRHAVQRHLKTKDPGYNPDRGKTPDCALLMKSIDDAEQRAENQLSQRARDGAPFSAPSTTVFELTRAIRSAAKSSKKAP